MAGTGLPNIRSRALVTPPTGVNDGGAAAISSAFSDIANVSAQIGDKLAQKEAARGTKKAVEAAKNVSGDTLEVPEREKKFLDFLSVEDEVFANVSGVLAMQRAEDAAGAEFDKLEVDHELNPVAFQKAAEAWKAGFLGGGAPVEIADKAEQMMNGMIRDASHRRNIARRKADNAEAKAGNVARIETITDQMDAFLRENGSQGAQDPAFLKLQADLTAQFQIRVNNPAFDFSPEEAERDLLKIDKTLKNSLFFKHTADFYETSYAADPETALQKSLEEIEGVVEGAGLGADESQKLRTSLRAELNAKHDLNEEVIKAGDVGEKRRKDLRAAKLSVGIGRNETNYLQLDQALEEGDISPAKWGELTKALDNHIKAEKKKIVDTSFSESVIAGRAVVNPFNPKHRKSISNYYDLHVAPALANSNDPAAVAVDFVQNFGVVPDAMKDNLTGTLLHGPVESQIQAVDILGRIEQANPIAYGQFPEKPRRLASIAAQSIARGQDEETAIVRAREVLFPTDPQTKQRKATANGKFINKAVDEGMKDLKLKKGTGEIAGMRLDYAAMYESEYLATGDEQTAHDQTQKRLQTVWGETSVFGDKNNVMRYPPELIYSNSGISEKQNGKWMKAQFHKDLDQLNVGFAQTLDTLPLKKSARLISDHLTARAENPSWMVYFEHDDGAGNIAVRPLMKEGLVVRWRPDWETSAMAKKMKRDQTREIAFSRAEHQNKLFGTPIPPEHDRTAVQLADRRARLSGTKKKAE